MNNPAIVFTAPRIAELLDAEIPQIKSNEVLVEIAFSTISAGTERANLIGDPNINSTKGPEIKFPRSAGYSTGGTVVAVGEEVTTLKVGDRVACSWTKHKKYCAVKESRAYLLPQNIDLDEAALVHIATFPMAAIRKCRLEMGEPAIVMGQGILGLIAVELLRAAGAYPVIAVDPVEKKRAQALSLGADYALDPFAPDFAATVKKLTGGGAKVAIEVTGKGQGLDMVLDCMAPFGRVALLGCTRNSDFSIDYYRKVHGPGISLIGAHTNARPLHDSRDGWWSERDDAQAILGLLSGKRLNFKCLLEETYSPSQAPEVFTRLANEPFFPIVQFDWRNFTV